MIKIGERCNITGISIFDKEHLKVCLECQSRVWKITHPRLNIFRYILFIIITIFGLFGFYFLI